MIVKNYKLALKPLLLRQLKLIIGIHTNIYIILVNRFNNKHILFYLK